jgi:hypothetical protein
MDKVDTESSGTQPLSKSSIVNSVRSFLTSAGWTVADNQIAGAPDIIAERDGERLHVQAEIASEETHSALDHLGSTLISWSPDTPFALAYPLQQGHLDSVARCAPVLQRLGITIFWVADDKTVRWTEARSSPHPVLDARATADEPCAAGSTPRQTTSSALSMPKGHRTRTPQFGRTSSTRCLVSLSSNARVAAGTDSVRHGSSAEALYMPICQR